MPSAAENFEKQQNSEKKSAGGGGTIFGTSMSTGVKKRSSGSPRFFYLYCGGYPRCTPSCVPSHTLSQGRRGKRERLEKLPRRLADGMRDEMAVIEHAVGDEAVSDADGGGDEVAVGRGASGACVRCVRAVFARGVYANAAGHNPMPRPAATTAAAHS